jgi:hypothetical protein
MQDYFLAIFLVYLLVVIIILLDKIQDVFLWIWIRRKRGGRRGRGK